MRTYQVTVFYRDPDSGIDMDIQLDIEAEMARTACHFAMHKVQTKFPKLYLVGATYAGPYETMEDQG